MLFEDVSLFLKLAARGAVCVVPEILCVWRLHEGSLSATKRERFPLEYSHLLDELRAENPGIEIRYSTAFRHADTRARYYQARLDMEMGKPAKARAIMAGITNVRPVYLALYLLSFMPPLWALVHGRTFKARLTNLFLRRRHGTSGNQDISG